MPQPTVFRSIPKSDVQVTRFDANKTWTVTNTDATASGYIPLNAIFYDTRASKKYDNTLGSSTPKESGQAGTEYGMSRSRFYIKPMDFQWNLNILGNQVTFNIFKYGLVPYSNAGTSVINQDGDETGALDGKWQIPGTQGVPDINYNPKNDDIFFPMPPSGSGVFKFNYWKFIVWDSLYHSFYKRPYDPAGTLQSNQADPNAMHKYLTTSASMLSIPQNKMGNNIKPQSIELTSNRFPFTITDDKYGNLQIPNDYINTGSFAPNDNLVAYWGFNELSRQSRLGYFIGKWESHNTYTSVKFDSGQFAPSFVSSGSRVAFRPGIKSTGTVHNTGFAANFGDSELSSADRKLSYIKTHNFVGINPTDDFAWSTWIHAGTNQLALSPTDTDRDIISKYGVERSWKKVYTGPSYLHFKKQYPSTGGFAFMPNLAALIAYATAVADPTNHQYRLTEDNVKRNRYPYRIGMYDQNHASAGHVYVRRSDGKVTTDFSSSADLRNTDAHIVLQKTGSMLELWVNGIRDNSGSTLTAGCNNNSMIMFGASDKSGSNSYSGSVDEVRYYDTALTSDQISSLSNNHYLSGSAYQTNVIGNAFRSYGYVVASSPYWFWNDIFTQEYNWSLKYKSSVDIDEYNVLVNVPKGYFNVTQNPSGRQSIYTDRLLGNFSGSMRPYVSTIGLYDDVGHLLAVGKLSNAIQKRNDVDMNFVIRWDM